MSESLFDVATLTASEREVRVREVLIPEAYRILDEAIVEHITGGGHTVAAVALLFSGGNDSTVLAHLFRQRLTHAIHANTGIGIEATRDFVRNTCEEWGIPLLERHAPRAVDSYRHLVLTDERGKKGQALGGFPGPAMHWKTYSRLKERALRVAQRELVGNPRRQRVVYLAGRRRDESKRRAKVPKTERIGSVVWVSPLVNWTKADLNTYRLMKARDGDPVPVNETANLIHMSGECLCGAMASPGERAEVSYWIPLAFVDVDELERLLADREDIPDHRKTWGWGADPALKQAETDYLAQFDLVEDEPLVGPLCSSCVDRFQASLFDEVVA